MYAIRSYTRANGLDANTTGTGGLFRNLLIHDFTGGLAVEPLGVHLAAAWLMVQPPPGL